MKKIGRNELCPCGSGKKYKKCCFNKPADSGTFIYTDLDLLSNKINSLLKEEKLDEAEQVCRQLKKEFPEQIDGIERYAQLYEAQGENSKAADYYRKAANFAQQAEGFDQGTIDFYLSQANALDKK